MNVHEYKAKFKNQFKLNSLIACTCIEGQTDKLKKITPNKSNVDSNLTDGLHMCNSLYLYTNPPPIAYGTPAPKTAETVLRAYSYNRKTENRSYQLGNWEVENTAIKNVKDFPLNQVSGNYIPSYVSSMAKVYKSKNWEAIDQALEHVIHWLAITPADEMSKGRQTWDPESEKSITCSKAYSRTLQLIEDNLNETPTTIRVLLLLFIKLLSLDSLKIRKREVVLKIKGKYDIVRRISYKQTKKNIVIKKSKIIGNENVFKYMIDYSRSFCSYLKHKERGKKDRRAIASGNIFLRLLLKIVEEFHLHLSKNVSGNTIGIGGDQKKAKIMTELKACTEIDLFKDHPKIQGTEDATKWNECLTPSMFALVHHSFFSETDCDFSRDTTGLKEKRELMLKICDLTFMLMSIKRIHLGPGLMIENDKFYNRKQWDEYKLDELNLQTRTWYSQVKISGKNYIEASPGFLMGMLNAASTTIGLLPSNFINIPSAKIQTLRSSDDSMTVYVAKDSKTLLNLLVQNYICCKLVGINMSTKKTIFFPEGYGEFTSWYQDKDFVGQSGTETSSLRPSGTNPQEDFNNVAIQTAVSMRTHTINFMGALQKLMIGIINVRSLYNIEVKEREELTHGVTFLADGGLNPWNLTNLLIDESTIRESKLKTDKDKSYFYKIMSPTNPFVQPVEESYLYSRDQGSMVLTKYDAPTNVFNFIRRSNRTINNQTSKLEADREKAYREAYQIATMVDPSLYLSGNSKLDSLSNHLDANIRVVLSGVELTATEVNEMNKALKRLRNENDNDDPDSCFVHDDFNFDLL
ncbi:MAG: polymerase PB1 [Bactrocera correcta orthomyxo-like virus isolate Bz]|nr:MAG: polymerase PB1 [Bactrocera correcta orthomyxo-like virus isolate Bz]